jgi:hypothetical protein
VAEVPTVPTFVDGVLSSSELNQLGDALRFLQSPPKVKAYQTVAQSLANGSLTVITFDTTEFDTHTMWSSGAPTRVTILYPGYYFLSGGVATVVNDTSYRYARIAVNGTTITDGNTAVDPVPSISTRVPARATITYLNVDDYVELYAQHAIGGSLNTAVAVGDASDLVVAWMGQR